MTIVLNGNSGITDVNGTASAPAITGTVSTNTGMWFPAANTVAWSTNGTEAMRVDSSGNLGLGVTPSAWSGYKVFEFTIGGVLWSPGASATRLGSNYYYNGTNFIYKASNAAADYRQNTGAHEWHTAPSGTAGTAITFTQAMTLDASGNLGVATTSPSTYGKLAVRGGITVSAGTTSLTGTSFFASDAANSSFWISHSSANVNLVADSPLTFWGPSGSGVAERMRIDSSGNLFIGTTSALVSTGTGKLNIQQTGALNAAVYFANSSSAFTSDTLRLGNGTTAGTGWNHIACYVSTGTADQFAASVMYVRGNGNLVNTNNSYGAISDIKLKENVVDATPKLDGINALRVVNFNFKGNSQKQIGLIAQEVEKIFPGIVEETQDRDVEGNDLVTTTKSVKYSVFVPMLIKAIQEQQAIIEQLKARLDAANL